MKVLLHFPASSHISPSSRAKTQAWCFPTMTLLWNWDLLIKNATHFASSIDYLHQCKVPITTPTNAMSHNKITLIKWTSSQSKQIIITYQFPANLCCISKENSHPQKNIKKKREREKWNYQKVVELKNPRAETITAIEAAANTNWPSLSPNPLTLPGLPNTSFISFCL